MPDERSTSSQAGGDNFYYDDDEYGAETAAPLPWYRSTWVLGGLLIALIGVAAIMLFAIGDDPDSEATATTVASLTPVETTPETTEPTPTTAPEATTTTAPATTEPAAEPVAPIATTPPATVATDSVTTLAPATEETGTTAPPAPTTPAETTPDATAPPASDATTPPTSAAPDTTVAPAVSYAGTGDERIALPVASPEATSSWAMRISHAGSGGFSISTEDFNGDQATIVDVTGAYSGDRPFGFGVVDLDSIQVVADGDWTIDLIPLDQLPMLGTDAGATVDGQGDRLVRFAPGAVSSVGFACDDCAGPIVITEFRPLASEIIVNGAGTGSSFLSNLDLAADVEVIAVQTTSGDVAGTWQLVVNP